MTSESVPDRAGMPVMMVVLDSKPRKPPSLAIIIVYRLFMFTDISISFRKNLSEKTDQMIMLC